MATTTYGLRKTDVLFGRGTGPNDFPGNIAFRALAETFQTEYVAAHERGQKAMIARKIVEQVHARNGRFLRKIEQPASTSSTSPAATATATAAGLLENQHNQAASEGSSLENRSWEHHSSASNPRTSEIESSPFTQSSEGNDDTSQAMSTLTTSTSPSRASRASSKKGSAHHRGSLYPEEVDDDADIISSKDGKYKFAVIKDIDVLIQKTKQTFRHLIRRQSKLTSTSKKLMPSANVTGLPIASLPSSVGIVGRNIIACATNSNSSMNTTTNNNNNNNNTCSSRSVSDILLSILRPANSLSSALLCDSLQRRAPVPPTIPSLRNTPPNPSLTKPSAATTTSAPGLILPPSVAQPSALMYLLLERQREERQKASQTARTAQLLQMLQFLLPPTQQTDLKSQTTTVTASQTSSSASNATMISTLPTQLPNQHLELGLLSPFRFTDNK